MSSSDAVWFLNDSDRAWKELGKTEPYSAVLAHDSLDDFFESGQRHVEAVLQIIREQLDPGYKPFRALDFGCGVGRLVIPLARHYDEVVGVDVSEAMLAEARRNCTERDLKNVKFVVALDLLAASGIQFDLVHTYIVLQHIPSPRGMAILSQLVDLVSVGGIGVLHLQYWREASALRKLINRLRRCVPLFHNLGNLAQGLPIRQPSVQMNVYPVQKVLFLLQQKKCHNVVLRFTETQTGGYLGLIIIFRKEDRTDFS